MAAEKQFETKVKKFLDENECYFIKFFANSYTKVGVPDVLACIGGKFVGIELKASNGKPTELQLYNLHKIEVAGGYGILLYPKDFELFKQLVNDLKSDHYSYVYEELRREWVKRYGKERRSNTTE